MTRSPREISRSKRRFTSDNTNFCVGLFLVELWDQARERSGDSLTEFYFD